jgi:hypothetical protein
MEMLFRATSKAKVQLIFIGYKFSEGKMKTGTEKG